MEIGFISKTQTKKEDDVKFKGVKLSFFDQLLVCRDRRIFKLWNFWCMLATKARINKKWKWSGFV